MKKLGLADLREIVSDADELAKGARIFDDKALAHLARYENKVFGEAAGSGASPYKVSLVFGDGPREVKGRCSCMAARSRPFCKHAAALLVAWARAPESFAESTAPPPESGGGAKKAVKKGATDATALMRDGVERVATLVRELAASGVASLGADRVPQLRTLAEGLRENKLRRLSARVLELGALLGRAVADRSSPPPVPYTDLLADALLTVRKLEKHVAGEPLDDRHVEELVGKTWRKADRRPVTGLDLVEYAFTAATTADGFLIRESRFVDVASGGHYSEKQILPSFLVKRTQPKRSYAGRLLAGAAGSVYPGYPPSRLDLEAPGAEAPLGPEAVLRLVERALPGAGPALSAFQEHHKDVFAPDLLPVAVRVEMLYAGGRRVQVVDGDGNALHLPEDPGLDEQIAGTLRGVRLRALVGDLGLESTLPTLFPCAAVVEGPLGAELRPLGVAPASSSSSWARGARQPDSAASSRSAWAEAARAAGAGEAAISLGEVREDLADCFVTGLGSLTPRATEPLAARLRQLGLDKPAALLASLAQRPDPGDRLDDFVKLYQVLGIALVRLAGVAQIDRASLVAVPTYESVSVPRPTEKLEPREAAALCAAGRLNRYQAAVQVARHYESLPDAELAASIFPTWADGSVSPFVARALAPRGAPAVAIARSVLEAKSRAGRGRIARMTALRVLAAVGSPEALADVAATAKAERDPGLRGFAADLLAEREPGDGAEAARKRRAALAARVAEASGELLTASQKETREAAARKLAELGSLSAAPALRSAYRQDATFDVREAAALALGKLGDAEMVPALVAQLEARADDEDEAKVAAYALGHMGDARGVYALLDAYVEGWKPAIVAEALKSLGPVALEPLVLRVEDQPEIAQRKAALGVVAQLDAPDVSAFLTARLQATRAHPRFAERATLYLKLVSERKDIQKAIATAISALVPNATSPEEKALLRAVGRAR
jgi:hypothetical protein